MWVTVNSAGKIFEGGQEWTIQPLDFGRRAPILRPKCYHPCPLSAFGMQQ
jgi:hypothetical protein